MKSQSELLQSDAQLAFVSSESPVRYEFAKRRRSPAP
jgi:hypothetical protein